MGAQLSNPIPPPPLDSAGQSALVLVSSMTGNTLAVPNTDNSIDQAYNEHESLSASFAHQALDSTPSRDLSIPPPSMVSEEQSVTSGSESQQVSEPLSPTESIPSVEIWAYDRTGLDSTNTQETALDRLSVYDSTPYVVVSPLNEQQISLETMPPLSETPSMDTPPLREDVQVRDFFLLLFKS